MIKAVFFDLDGTVYDYDYAHPIAMEKTLETAEREAGISRETFKRLYSELNDENKKRMGKVAAVHNRLIRMQNILEREGKPLTSILKLYDAYWGTFLEVMQPEPGVPEVFKTLKEMGYKVGFGTNMTARMQFLKLEKLGILPYVDYVVSSEEVSAEKPVPVLYARCAEKAGAEPGECLFVGDTLKGDVVGPTEFGMKALWYHTGEKEVPEGVIRIRNLNEIPALIREMV